MRLDARRALPRQTWLSLQLFKNQTRWASMVLCEVHQVDATRELILASVIRIRMCGPEKRVMNRNRWRNVLKLKNRLIPRWINKKILEEVFRIE